MKKLPHINFKYGAPVFIAAISILSFWRWFTSGIHTDGDWSFQYANTLKDWITLSFSWSTSIGLGGVDLTSSSWPQDLIKGSFGLLGASSALADKIVFFLPITILTGLSSYLLINKVLNSRLAAVAGSIVFCYNTYFLFIQTRHLTELVTFSIAPLVLFSFIKTLESRSLLWAILTALTSILLSIFDFRIYYILFFVLSIYLAFHITFKEKINFKSLFKELSLSFLSLLLVALLNMYWVIGLTKTGSVVHNAIFDRGLFGSEFLNVPRSLTLFHPFWNGAEPVSFVINPIPLYFWFIPVLVVLALLANRKNYLVLFFGLLSIVGILLTKQEDAPFQSLYLWLYQHFPGFNAFREASKFYFLIALGYSVLISALIKWVWENRLNKKGLLNKSFNIGKYALVIFVSAIFLWNLKPFITGEIGTLFVSRSIPGDYLVFKEFILSQPNYGRTYWLPLSPRWAIYTSNQPKIDGASIYQGDWKNLVTNGGSATPSNQQIVNMLKTPYTQQLLNQSAIRYLAVPIRDEKNNDDFFIYYGDDRKFYIDTLNSLPYLKRVNLGTNDLAVYENATYKPYVSSPKNLYQIPSPHDLGNTFSFAQNQLSEKDFNFITPDKAKDVPTISLSDIFSNLGLNSFQSGKITKNLSNLSNIASTLFANTNKPAISYQVTTDCVSSPKTRGKKSPCISQSNLNVFSDNKNLVNLNSTSLTNSGETKTTILSQKLSNDKTYLFGIGQTPFNIDTTGSIKNIGTVDQLTTLYSRDNSNLIPNPSFERGLWQKDVTDCNNYDSRALIGMRLDTADSTDGYQSLQLDTDQHTACTGPGLIAVTPGENYLLTFNFEIHNTKDIEYELDFDDPKKTILKEQINAPSDNWRPFQKIITVPDGATSLNLMVYGIPDQSRQNHATTRYDNFYLGHLIKESPVNANIRPLFQNVPINSNTNASYLDPYYTYQNLISNPSLEKGLWKTKVGDCNAYDNNAALNMRLDSHNRTDGNKSLQLEAKRHTACTGPSSIPIKENFTYRLSFDFQSPNGTNASYYVSFDDPAHTATSEDLPITDTLWHTATKYFHAPPGATHANLSVYSYAEPSNAQYIITRYDNFSLIEVPDIQGRYFLVTPPSTQTSPPTNITYDSANSTLKHVHVSGATKPFYVAMSESYHDQWRLELNNPQVNGRLRGWIPWVHPNAVGNAQHFKLNDFENGWYVDPAQICKDNPKGCTKNADGSYNLEMQIEFVPQRWFYLGTLISAITLFGCLSYLGFYLIRKITRRKNKLPYPKDQDKP